MTSEYDVYTLQHTEIYIYNDKNIQRKHYNNQQRLTYN